MIDAGNIDTNDDESPLADNVRIDGGELDGEPEEIMYTQNEYRTGKTGRLE